MPCPPLSLPGPAETQWQLPVYRRPQHSPPSTNSITLSISCLQYPHISNAVSVSALESSCGCSQRKERRREDRPLNRYRLLCCISHTPPYHTPRPEICSPFSFFNPIRSVFYDTLVAILTVAISLCLWIESSYLSPIEPVSQISKCRGRVITAKLGRVPVIACP